MTNYIDQNFEPACYRVRLFLSADLSGSTEFKNSKHGENYQEGISPKWVSVFQHFYTDFPVRYATNYQDNVNSTTGFDNCPKLWKAVGDELVFCGKVSTKKSIWISLSSFIETLHDYRKHLFDQQTGLNIKGAAWLAAFPEPNRAVQLQRSSKTPDFISASEALEAAADEQPYDYDFLGKAIDTGFRVATIATPERFALSVQLARLLVSSPPAIGFAHDIHFDQTIALKGVNRGEPYPVLFIDTMEHLPTKDARMKERDLLNKSESSNRNKISGYLEAYCRAVGTDEIMLRNSFQDESPDEPKSYTDHKERILEHFRQEKYRGSDEKSDTAPDTEDNAEEENSDDQLNSILNSEYLSPISET